MNYYNNNIIYYILVSDLSLLMHIIIDEDFHATCQFNLLYIAFNFFINIYYNFKYIRVILEHFIYILDNFLKKIS